MWTEVSELKKFKNYIGQLRLYSLADLVLFLWAAGATAQAFAGGLVLWIGFLCYLEGKHRHAYRQSLVPYIWLPLLAWGELWYRDWGVVFFFFGILYAEKKRPGFVAIAPLFRGAQMVALAAPLLGIEHPFTWAAGVLTVFRNLLGDIRDAGKDAQEEVLTIPVLVGLRRNVPYIHLIGMMATSFIWWSWGDMPMWVLFGTWVVQLSTYHLTPR